MLRSLKIFKYDKKDIVNNITYAYEPTGVYVCLYLQYIGRNTNDENN